MNFVGSIPRGRPGTSGFQGTTGKSGFSGYAPSTPPLPAFSNIALVASLWNWNPVGYPAGKAIEDSDYSEYYFLAPAPYPVDWTAVAFNPQPELASIWFDQNSNTNDLIQSGSARPNLVITSSVLVSGAGTSAANGVYTYRGQANGKAYYNLLGQSSNPNQSSIAWFDDHYGITASNGDSLYESFDAMGFPWTGTDWAANLGIAPAPTVAVQTQGGMVSFDGVAQGLQSSGNLYVGGSTTGTIYLDYQPLDLVSTAVIFETGVGTAAGLAQNISIRQVGAVLTCSVYDNTAVVALANTKIVTLVNTNRIWIAFTFDTTNGTVANQTALKVNNSSGSVTSPVSTNLNSLAIGDAKVSLGSRNNAASAFNHCNMWTSYSETGVDSGARQLEFYNRWVYLVSLAP